jgi:hypothetical protein
MPRRKPLTKLREREQGFELSGFEQTMIFQNEDRGYVRFMNRAMGMFFLDPSSFQNTPYDEIYISPPGKFPPIDRLIKVTVRETDKYPDLDPATEGIRKYILKFVSDWQEVNPNEIRGNKLFNLDEFLNCAALPISDKNLPFDDIKYCLGMYLVASPQLSQMEQGGINTVILGTKEKKTKWMNFKRMTSIIPQEFRRVSSKNYYKSIKLGQPPKTPDSFEVSFAFLNREDTPIQIPMPFEDMKFRSYYSYKGDFQERMPMARAYLLDTLLFKPEIPKNLRRRVEEAMVFMVDEVLVAEDIPCYQDVGSAVTKLTTSFARLNFNQNATLSDLNEGKELWFTAMELSKKQHKPKGGSKKRYKPTPEQEILYAEINELDDSGIPLTLENIKAYTKVDTTTFEDALYKLKISGKIYFPNNDTIGLIKS